MGKASNSGSASGHALFQPKVTPAVFEKWLFVMSGIGAGLTLTLGWMLSEDVRDPDIALWIILVLGVAYSLGTVAFALRMRAQRRFARRAIQDLRYGFSGTVGSGLARTGRSQRMRGITGIPAIGLLMAVLLAMAGLAFVYLHLWEK